MEFFVKTDVGIIRSNNEDSYFANKYTVQNKDIYVFIVADGMGGYEKGEVASFTAVDMISKQLEDNLDNVLESKEEIKRCMEQSIKNANIQIYSDALKDEKYLGMGTTLVVSVVIENNIYIANIGDSRAYLYNNDEFLQITKDNSYVQELLEKGVIDEEQAKKSTKKNVITRAIGAERRVLVDFYEIIISKDDMLLMCTDGLTNMVEDKIVKEILKENISLDEKVEKLIQTANNNGGKDNITILLASY